VVVGAAAAAPKSGADGAAGLGKDVAPVVAAAEPNALKVGAAAACPNSPVLGEAAADPNNPVAGADAAPKTDAAVVAGAAAKVAADPNVNPADVPLGAVPNPNAGVACGWALKPVAPPKMDAAVVVAGCCCCPKAEDAPKLNPCPEAVGLLLLLPPNMMSGAGVVRVSDDVLLPVS
jgi:hypothetical protein